MAGSAATFSRLTPMLTTDDMDATIAFYRDVLGFEVTSQIPDENPTWCFLLRDDAALMFTTPEEHDHSGDDDGHSHDHSEGDGHSHDHEHSGADGLWTMYVYSNEVETLWDELRNETKVVYPLFDTHYGMREFGIRDCDGNVMSFGRDI